MQGGIRLQGLVWDEKSDTIGLKGDYPNQFSVIFSFVR